MYEFNQKMKKIIIASVKQTILLLVSLFLFSNSTEGQEQIKEKRVVNTFVGIDVSRNVEVFISQGDSINVVVEAIEDIMPSIVTEVSGGVLKLTTSDRNKSLLIRKSSVTIYVTVPILTSLSVNTNSKASILSEFLIDHLDLSVSTAGQIDINNRIIIEKELTINSKTKGKITSKGDVSARSASMTIASNGEVNLPLSLSGNLECIAIGSSKAFLVGKAEEAFLSANSKSELKLKNFKLKRANVVAMSSAVIQIYVEDFLAATAADRAVVDYSGKPKTVNRETTTGGKIK